MKLYLLSHFCNRIKPIGNAITIATSTGVIFSFIKKMICVYREPPTDSIIFNILLILFDSAIPMIMVLMSSNMTENRVTKLIVFSLNYDH